MGKKRINTVTGNTSPSNKEYLDSIEELHQDDLNNGFIYNKKAVDEASSVQNEYYRGIDKYDPVLPEGFFDPYEDYIAKGTLRGGGLDIAELNKMRAENQSNWEQAGHAFKRVGMNVIPNILGGIASMTDIKGYWDAEHAANNEIVKWSDRWQQNVNEESAPIYLDNPGKSMDLGDASWWFDRGSGLATSVISFLAQGAGAGKVVSVGLKGLGAVTKGKDLTRAVLKGKQGLKGAQRSKQLLGGMEGLTTSTMLNQSEAAIEASQVYQNTYDSLLDQGFSFDQAKQKASIAASTTMNLNRINILLNLSSAKAFIRPQKFTRQLIKNPSLGRSLGLTAVEGGKEAMEELINHVASKAGMATGEGKDYTFQDALNDMGTMEGFEAAFLGSRIFQHQL